MTDRELLELAAKAADEVVVGVAEQDRTTLVCRGYAGKYCWNPLTDDGDALRLAVKLNLSFLIAAPYSYAGVSFNEGPKICEKHNNDSYAATRRAIVRAAAEIWKEMK